MSDLTEFLLARIAEDEELAREAAGINGGFEGGDRHWCPDWLYTGIRHLVRNCDVECPTHEDTPEKCGWPHRYAGAHVASWDPARVLAECDAKRRIVEDEAITVDDTVSMPLACLALPYADHPDYDETWRP